MSDQVRGEDEWSLAGNIPGGEADHDNEPRVLPPRAWKAGDVVDGKFEISGRLGKGGMGVVYQARELSSRREVALKLLSAQRLQPAQRDRFRREGELTATLSHPGIVRIHSAGAVDGVPYLAYELVTGGRTMGELLAADGRNVRQVVGLLRDVARAVGYAHERGVVHRDLKPENVLIDEAGRTRVADFGLAWREGQDRLTNTGALVGTPAFMAPEQFTRKHGEVGPATDVWALGVMLYLALTGERPFQARSLVELVGQVTSSSPRSPRELAPRTSPDLEAICLKALERDPRMRYPSGSAFANDLDNALADRPVAASSLAWRRWRRQRKPALAALLMTVAFASLIVLGYHLDPARRHGEGETRVRRLLSDFRHGLRERADLESALASDLPSEARAHVHVVLASGQGRSEEDWHQRVAHADEAIALTADSSLRSRAWRARGRALSALGLHALADESFTRASERSGNAETLLDLGRARLRAERWDRAAEAAERYLIRRPASFDGMELLTRVRLGQGLIAEARATAERCARSNPGPRAQALLAEVLQGEGSDPRAFLRRCLLAAPTDPDLRAALAQAEFERGELRAALAALEAAKRATDPPPLQRSLARLLGSPPDVASLAEAPPAWRRTAGRWLLRESARELAFVARAGDPLAIRSPNAIPLEDRRRRVSDALDAVAALGDTELAGELALARACLEGVGSDAGLRHLRAAEAALPEDPRVLLLSARERLIRGRPRETLAILRDLRASPLAPGERLAELRGLALVELRSYADALEPLAAADPQRLREDLLEARVTALAALGQDDAVRTLRERIELVRGKRRAEARQLKSQRTPKRRERPAWFARILDLDPANPEALIDAAKWRFKLGREHHVPALRALVNAMGRDPRYYHDILRDLFVFGHGSLSEESRSLPEILGRLTLTDSLADRSIRALFSTATVECHRLAAWEEPALAVVESVLAEDPANVPGYLMRGFLHLRAGRLALAERDLGFVLEESPDGSMVQFYLGLLRAAQGRPEEAAQQFARAGRLGFAPWRDPSWQLQVYPEVEPYLTLRGFEQFRRTKTGQ